ncbi:hypothetical protein TNCV_4187401 [Trichonephila clavipes]|nr:hypothetical protein TNCV_4187401 [Trichonephila clavipes]
MDEIVTTARDLELETDSAQEPDEIDDCLMIDEVVDISRKINLEVESDDVRELLGTHNQELTIYELLNA